MLKKHDGWEKDEAKSRSKRGYLYLLRIDPVPRDGPYLEGRGCGIVCEFFDHLLNHAWPVLFSFFDTILPLSTG